MFWVKRRLANVFLTINYKLLKVYFKLTKLKKLKIGHVAYFNGSFT